MLVLGLSASANAVQDDLMQLEIDLFSFESFADRIWEQWIDRYFTRLR
jgi:hypothetical protein